MQHPKRLLKGDTVMLYHIYKNAENGGAVEDLDKVIKICDTFRVHDVDNDGMIIFKYVLNSETKVLRFKYSQVGLIKRPLKNHLRIIGIEFREWIIAIQKKSEITT